MSLKLIQEIPSPQTIFNELPMPKNLKRIKDHRDSIIKDVFTGKSDKFVLIIGPCSADNEDAVCEYISRLGKIQEKVEDKIVIVPRVYTNKPRTTGEGYKGMVHQPSPTKKSDMFKGIIAMRKMHIRAINESHLTCADEMLYPENYAYLDDILSYVAIGARSVENQQHRLTVSGLEIPVGMKNATSGDITVMLNAIKAAQIEHTFIFRGWEVETDGNPLAHAILRGAVNRYGRNIANYHYEDIIDLLTEYDKMNLKNPAIIIDTNHANSNKQYMRQPKIALETIYNMFYDDDVKRHVKGLMIESYLVGGRQNVGDGVYGQSITDPCIGWEDTERLIFNIADKL
ncbi:3-deoxy-7-phosphoheptulonate synthase [Vallitalea okinawensis]|uniref:3-deoxy-7-phosphoheptulonate synthase n=1 Tax=Vallitalea okinawensis TaxID=2078660 RepID=UPI000CFE2412|nr:3-deoxy-7-phosphoheptulonate synthase [Vallitalea okinawensis]